LEETCRHNRRNAHSASDIKRLKEACDGYLAHAAGLRDENAKLLERIRFADQEFAAECAALRAENERLREALMQIAWASGDQPEAMNIPEADWYRRRFYDCVATAARAIKPLDELNADISAALQSKGEKE
jgi:hypothetical protein